MTSYAFAAAKTIGTDFMEVPFSDETTPITATNGKIKFRMPNYASTLIDVSVSLTAAQTSGNIFTVDLNESNTSVLSTKVTVKNTEKTSLTADAQPVISDSAIAANAEMSIDVDQVGASADAAGGKMLIRWRVA